MHPIRAFAVLVSAALLVGAASAASVADVSADRDPRRDVMRYSEDGEDLAPDHRNGDIVRHRLTYGDRRITAVIRFAQLRHNAPFLWIGVPITWPEGNGAIGYGDIEVEVDGDGPAQGHAYFGSNDADCRVRSRISYRTNRARLSIAARCLGRPSWVRAFTAAYTEFPDHRFVDTSPDNLSGGRGVRLNRG